MLINMSCIQFNRSIDEIQSLDSIESIDLNDVSNKSETHEEKYEVEIETVNSNPEVESDSISTASQTIRSIIVEYCLNTTIHGIQYFVEPKRHWIERYPFLVLALVQIYSF